MKDVSRFGSKHMSEILTLLGIGLGASTVFLAVKKTPEALKDIEEKKEELNVDELTPVETVQATWKNYIPAAMTGCASVICLIGANSVNAKRNAALATAYTLSEAARKEYRNKVIETIGEKKEGEVREKIAKDRLEDHKKSNNTQVIVTEKGSVKCLDSHSGRMFTTSVHALQKAEIKVNNQLRNDFYVSLNEFYDEIGLDRTRGGDDLGWNMNDGYVEISLSAILDEDDEPCLVLDYNIAPRFDYYKLM